MASALAIAATFNLVCAGTIASQDFAGDTSSPYAVTFRIDLEHGKWCDGACKALHDFADVSPTQITFARTDEPSRFVLDAVNRQTGHYLATRTGPGVFTMTIDAQCEKAPFSGFPSFPTKF